MCVLGVALLSACDDETQPTVTPSQTDTPTSAAAPTPGSSAPTAVSGPTATPAATPGPTVAPTPGASAPTVASVPTATPAATPRPTVAPTPAPTATPAPVPTPTASRPPTPTPTVAPDTAVAVALPDEPCAQPTEACQPRNVSEISPFGGNTGGFGAAAYSEPDDGPTVEEILAGDRTLPFYLQGPPVHIALRGTAAWDSVRCDWRGQANTIQQREERLRAWHGLEEDEPLPPAVELEGLVSYYLSGASLAYLSPLFSGFATLARGGLSTEVQTLSCYADYQIQEMSWGRDHPRLRCPMTGLPPLHHMRATKGHSRQGHSRDSRCKVRQSTRSLSRRELRTWRRPWQSTSAAGKAWCS